MFAGPSIQNYKAENEKNGWNYVRRQVQTEDTNLK